MTKIKIYGFNKTSEMGADTFAVSIFLGGCNLRCPYCLNSKLVRQEGLKEIPFSEVEAFAKENDCEWVNISGGEPTCHSSEDLLELILEIKSWGCKVGMGTNGTNLEILRSVISHLNFVALDIKSHKMEVYESLLANPKDNDLSMPAVNMIRSRGIMTEEKLKREDFDYELRTTLYPDFIDAIALRQIGQTIRKDDRWVLQQFRHDSNVLDKECLNVPVYNDRKVEKLFNIAKKVTSKAVLRHV